MATACNILSPDQETITYLGGFGNRHARYGQVIAAGNFFLSKKNLGIATRPAYPVGGACSFHVMLLAFCLSVVSPPSGTHGLV